MAVSIITMNQIEQQRMGGKKLPEDHRQIYKTIGGTPHLDMAYTVFGEVIKGQSVIDSIAGMPTNERNRPVSDVRIIKATLVKR